MKRITGLLLIFIAQIAHLLRKKFYVILIQSVAKAVVIYRDNTNDTTDRTRRIGDKHE
jgi:hypothetical protein